MQDIKTIMNQDLQVIESDTGNQTMSWMGSDYVIIPAELTDELSLNEGGFDVDRLLVLKVRTNQFTNGIYPLAQQLLTYDGLQYRIQKVGFDKPFKVLLRLTCIDDSRR